jgi:hypothetical protein
MKAINAPLASVPGLTPAEREEITQWVAANVATIWDDAKRENMRRILTAAFVTETLRVKVNERSEELSIDN